VEIDPAFRCCTGSESPSCPRGTASELAGTTLTAAPASSIPSEHRTSRQIPAEYRLPPAGIVSILHRVSGALMFLLGCPSSLWLFEHERHLRDLASSAIARLRVGHRLRAGLAGQARWRWR
jgi:hypothetical protein